MAEEILYYPQMELPEIIKTPHSKISFFKVWHISFISHANFHWLVMVFKIFVAIYVFRRKEYYSESRSVLSHSLLPHGLYSPRNSQGQNTGVSRLSLLQGIFPTQGWNPGLLHRRQILYQLSHLAVCHGHKKWKTEMENKCQVYSILALSKWSC